MSDPETQSSIAKLVDILTCERSWRAAGLRIGIFALIYAAVILFGRLLGTPVGMAYYFLSLFIGMALLGIYRISARSKHRFSITSLLYVTTIVSIYAAIYASLGEKGLVLSNSLASAFVWAQASFIIINRIVGNSLFFREAWIIYRDDRNSVVHSSWHWPSHIFAAFIVLVLWLVGSLFGISNASARYGFCMTFGLVQHIYAVRRTSITTYRDGIEIVGKFWRWEDGKLELFEDEGIYRLGPSRIVNERKWGKWLWPEVPAENLDAVREVLNRHYEQE